MATFNVNRYIDPEISERQPTLRIELIQQQPSHEANQYLRNQAIDPAINNYFAIYYIAKLQKPIQYLSTSHIQRQVVPN